MNGRADQLIDRRCQLAGLFSGPTRIWQFVPQFTQAIFNAGRLRSNVNLARAQQELALIEYDRVIQTAFREVSDVVVQFVISSAPGVGRVRRRIARTRAQLS